MTDKYPPYNEFRTSQNDLSKYSDIFDELTKIRQDIERDSMPVLTNHTRNMDTEVFSTPPDSLQQYYRFDHDHSEREGHGSLNADTKTTFSIQSHPFHGISVGDCKVDLTEPLIFQHGDDFSFRPKWEEHTEQHPKSDYCYRETRDVKTEEDYRHDDGSPIVIPLHQTGTRKSARHTSFVRPKPRSNCRDDQQNEHKEYIVDSPVLPWGAFSQYENETFLKLSRNASNLSLFLGWGAIACGVVVFVRSLFVSSMIWLNYGLPVIAIGAACLFLGIILSILSEKMQHINDLKQSLTAHRVLLPTKRKSEERALQLENHDELEDMYDRLIQLRLEINELIAECENPS